MRNWWKTRPNTDFCFAEASRAKHKFAVKRNSWPKTRGVAMNPVDHVSSLEMTLTWLQTSDKPPFYSPTVVVTTSTLVKHLLFPDTPPRVKKLVSSLHGEPVYFVVRKRRRSRCDVVWSFTYLSWFKNALLLRGMCI